MFSLKKWLGLASAASFLGAAGVAGLVAPASAAHAPPATSMIGVAAAKPNVNISGSPAKWSPTRLSVVPKNFTTCTASKVVWTISNKTSKGQTISVKVGTGPKRLLGTIKARTKVGVCSKGPAGTKETYSIKGSTSTLKLTLN